MHIEKNTSFNKPALNEWLVSLSIMKKAGLLVKGIRSLGKRLLDPENITRQSEQNGNVRSLCHENEVSDFLPPLLVGPNQTELSTGRLEPLTRFSGIKLLRS